jgi:hypothetical protein
MQVSSRISSLLITVLLLIGQEAQAEAGHYALLIGINEYASPKINNLNGAVNDVTMMHLHSPSLPRRPPTLYP